jgi:hypothetical protein
VPASGSAGVKAYVVLSDSTGSAVKFEEYIAHVTSATVLCYQLAATPSSAISITATSLAFGAHVGSPGMFTAPCSLSLAVPGSNTVSLNASVHVDCFGTAGVMVVP